jgi:hypothetical protein
LPLVLAGRFVGSVGAAAHTENVIFSPWQVWWFLGPHLHRILPATPWATRLEPHWLSVVAHPLIVAVALPLTLLCVWLRRRGITRPKEEALLLLVLLFLLRCALDPWDNWYYPLPFLLALLTWEVVRGPRAPVFSLLAVCASWCVTKWAPGHGVSNDVQSVIFLIFTIPALAAMLLALYAPRQAGRWAVLLSRTESLATSA